MRSRENDPMTSFIRILSALALLALSPFAARAQEGKLVLYTSQPNQDAQQTLDAFKAKYPKIDATFVRDGTTRVMAKLKAEIDSRPAAGRRGADRRFRLDGGIEEGRPVAGLSQSRRLGLSRRHPRQGQDLVRDQADHDRDHLQHQGADQTGIPGTTCSGRKRSRSL